MKRPNKKIAIIVSSLGRGGAQKASANLSILMHQLNCDVHIISLLNKIDFVYAGKLLNLGKLKDMDNSIFGKFKRFLIFHNYLKTEKFDFIIDSRARPIFLKEFLIKVLLYYNQKVIYIVHSYFVKNYIPNNKFFAGFLYGKAYKIVTVSEEIKNLIDSKYKFERLQTIHNCIVDSTIIMPSKQVQKLPRKFILFFGRINDKVKNISLLIESYALSKLPTKDVHLVVLGDGPDTKKLKQKAQSLNIETKVVFFPFQVDPTPIIKNALYSVLTSRYEGFGMVLIESLLLGIPVVSVDCKSGPGEIIKSEFNGLLVENYNPIALANAFDRMVEDEKLYLNCCKNASMSVEKFSVSNISEAWKAILNNE